MNQLLIKQPANTNITRNEFIEDVECLFSNLKELYAMYDYFGENEFLKAKSIVIQSLSEPFDFDLALHSLKEALSFIKDGHFYIGFPENDMKSASYAIAYSEFQGIPLIDCKKFYYDTDEEKEQLEAFVNKAFEYRNNDPLILDFRGNVGGSSTYIFDFLEKLLQTDIEYSFRYMQRCSDLYLEYLRNEGIDWIPENTDVYTESFCKRIANTKPIYVFIDSVTASAAEEGIAALRNIEHVSIVGDHSAGRASCGNCIPIYLPNSHIKAYFGTGIVLYDGDRNVDAEGGFKGDISFAEFEEEIKRNNIFLKS